MWRSEHLGAPWSGDRRAALRTHIAARFPALDKLPSRSTASRRVTIGTRLSTGAVVRQAAEAASEVDRLIREALRV